MSVPHQTHLASNIIRRKHTVAMRKLNRAQQVNFGKPPEVGAARMVERATINTLVSLEVAERQREKPTYKHMFAHNENKLIRQIIAFVASFSLLTSAVLATKCCPIKWPSASPGKFECGASGSDVSARTDTQMDWADLRATCLRPLRFG